MPEHSYTSRRELDQYRFHPVVTVLAPLACILVQVEAPRLWPPLALLDLPLLAVIFFALSRRSPQDGLTNHPFGIFGIAKGLIGYCAASIGFAIDAENWVNRGVMVFAFSLLQSAILYFIQHGLLGDHSFPLMPIHQLIAAAANTVVALPLFFMLDRFRIRE
jgi:rod shape-determining protein MreD